VTGYQVDTDYLYGYANQVEMNRAFALATLARYGGTHLTNFDRFTGLFEPAQWIPEFFANQVNGKLFPALNDLMAYVFKQLNATADAYDTADRNARHKVVAAGVWNPDGRDVGGGFNPFPAEEEPRKPAASLGFTDGAEINPKVPDDPHMTEWVEGKLEDLLGKPVELIKKFTGYDIIAEWAPVVLGDWGAAYRVADAWTEVAHSLRAIGADLEGGLNLLTPAWTAGDGSGAAATFGRFAHDKFGAIPVFAELADAVNEAVKVPAIYYEGVIKNAFWVIEYFGVRFKAVAKKISKAFKDLTVNPKTWIDLGEEVWGIVEDYIEFVKTTFEALKTCVQLIIQMGELAIEVIDLVAVTLEWKLGGS
jgi:hypothetical protein